MSIKTQDEKPFLIIGSADLRFTCVLPTAIMVASSVYNLLFFGQIVPIPIPIAIGTIGIAKNQPLL